MITIKTCQEVAKSRNGQCLSNQYNGIHSPLLWRCNKCQYTWTATLNGIKHGNSWCPNCAKNRKITIEECQQLAIFKHGKCLSTEYKNYKQKLIWQCEYKHIWEASYGSIKHSNSWCPHCYGNVEYTLQDCIKFALSKNGKCISKEYINANSKLEWLCDNGHVWYASFNKLLNAGQWCKKCAIDARRLNIEDCIKFAHSKNGKCLSKIYKNNTEKIAWQCENNHIWLSSFNNLKNYDRWCPKCNDYQISKPQKEIYFLLSAIYNMEIILNDTKTISPFDLDIYIPSLNCAIEYDGWYWHYSDWAIQNKDSLKNMARKDDVCHANGIDLIHIDEHLWINDKELEFQKIIDFIENKSCRNQ